MNIASVMILYLIIITAMLFVLVLIDLNYSKEGQPQKNCTTFSNPFVL